MAAKFLNLILHCVLESQYLHFVLDYSFEIYILNLVKIVIKFTCKKFHYLNLLLIIKTTE